MPIIRYTHFMERYMIVIPVCALLAQIVLVFFHKRKTKKTMQKIGTCLFVLPNEKQKLFMVVAACAPLLSATLFIRDLGLLLNLVIAVSSLLILELSLRHLFLRPVSGIYEGALIYEDRIILRTIIEQVLDQGETGLRLIGSTNEIINITFETGTVRDEVAKILRL